MLDRSYLLALALTLLCEAPLVLVGFWTTRPRWRVVWAFVAANLFTHGLLWASWNHLPGDYLTRLVVCELLVFAVEAGLYRALLGVSLLRAGLVSAAANLFSTFVGLLFWI